MSFCLIETWMCKQLNLSGNELLTFALIYGFSKDGKSEYYGGRKYISDMFNISMSTVDNTLKSLCKKGLIEKIDRTKNNVTLYSYKSLILTDEAFQGGSLKITPPSQNLREGSLKITTGSVKITPNSIDNIQTNIQDNSVKETKAKKSMVETVVDEFPIFVNNPDLRKEYLDFAEMRKAKGKKYEMKVESTVRTNIKNLLKLGGEDVELLKAIIERSIERCWDGFFPLPDNTEKPYYGSKPKNNGTKDWDDMRDMLCDSRLSSQNSLSNTGNVTALPSESSSTYMDSESFDILNLFK